MPNVRIPTPLRNLTDGAAEVRVDAHDLRGVIAGLEEKHPGLAARILDDDGELRRFVNVFVRDEDVRFQAGLDTEVGESDTVSIVPAVAGGCVTLSYRVPVRTCDRSGGSAAVFAG